MVGPSNKPPPVAIHTLGTPLDHVLGHIPVLLKEVIGALAPAFGQTYADCTVGLGGHALEVARILGPTGTVVMNDVDSGNLGRARSRLQEALGSQCPRLVTFTGSFARLPRRMAEAGIRADMVLADLGFASNQMDDPERGFSFSREGPLDMRLASNADPEAQEPPAPSAAELVASLPEAELIRILREYGEERRAGAIARKIAASRRTHPISTTTELASIVRSAVGRSDPGGIDPATRTFQALRIAVNDELGHLDALLHAIGAGMARTPRTDWLAPRASVGIISFHSLEDRPIKAAFGRLVGDGFATDITGGPVAPAETEIGSNPRSRSAKLRAIGRR